MKAKRILSTIVAFAMIVSTMGISVFASNATLIDLSAGNAVIDTAGDYTVSGTTSNTLSVKSDATITLQDLNITANENESAISIESGNVNLIIAGDVILTGGKYGAGIYVAKDATVTISGDGTLTAVGNGGTDTNEPGAAGIGGSSIDYANGTSDSGTIIIDGANVTATGYGKHGAGIGSAYAGISGEITIKNSANVTAQGGHFVEGGPITSSWGKNEPEGGAGIGGGSGRADAVIGNIVIDGSVVIAKGGQKAAGIGAGYHSGCDTIKIANGSEVEAYGGASSAGIGTSRTPDTTDGADAKVSTANIIIENSTVNAVGGDAAAGIGTGYNCNKPANIATTSIAISDNANVTAVGGKGGAAIGGGITNNNLDIDIQDSQIDATAGAAMDAEWFTQYFQTASSVNAYAIGSGANEDKTDYTGSDVAIDADSTVYIVPSYYKYTIEEKQADGTLNTIEADVTVANQLGFDAIIGETEYKTLAEATDAAEELIANGETTVIITLTKDVSLTNRQAGIEPSVNGVIYDLDGHTLTLGGDHVITTDTTFKNGNIKITDEKADTGVFWLWNSSNTVTFEKVNFSNAGESINACSIFFTAPDSNGVIPTDDCGDFVFTDCTINLTNNTYDHSAGANLFYFQDNTSKVTMTGGSIDIDGFARGLQYGTYDIDGAEIEMTNMSGNCIRRAEGSITDTKLTFNGCENGIKLDSATTLTIEGDSVVVIKNATEKITDIKDGGELIIKSGACSFDPDAYLVDGTQAVYSNTSGLYNVVGTWTVNVAASVDELYAGETVDITVKVDGADFANAGWTINYDATKFEFVSKTEMKNDAQTANTATAGIITDVVLGTTGTNEFTSADILATYTFKALEQEKVETDNFIISETFVNTMETAAMGDSVAAANNNMVSVTILLKDMTTAVTMDGTEITLDTESKYEMDYDGTEHKFAVKVTDPVDNYDKIEYSTDGGNTWSETAPNFTEVGEYEVQYKIDAVDGYANKEGSFKVVIKEPAYKIEVVNNNAKGNPDYVAGYTMILVYTNTDKAYFTYDNAANVMYDVTAAGYEYAEYDENGSVVATDDTAYAHVYGLVVPAITASEIADYNERVAAYKAKVAFTSNATPEVISPYDYDVNFSSKVDINDVTATYGVYNANGTYMSNYMRIVLKADVTKDKIVDTDDINPVKIDAGLQ